MLKVTLATIVIGPLRASSAVLPYTVLCTCSFAIIVAEHEAESNKKVII